jgi:hypothetical protein
VLLPDPDDETRVLRIARRALEPPVVLDGLEVEVGGSIGEALAPDPWNPIRAGHREWPSTGLRLPSVTTLMCRTGEGSSLCALELRL